MMSSWNGRQCGRITLPAGVGFLVVANLAEAQIPFVRGKGIAIRPTFEPIFARPSMRNATWLTQVRLG